MNATSNVHVAPAATLVPHVLFEIVKLFESVAIVTPVSAAVPTLFKLIVCVALVPPTFKFPNAKPVGDSSTTELDKLPALINTLESSRSSPASAIANLM